MRLAIPTSNAARSANIAPLNGLPPAPAPAITEARGGTSREATTRFEGRQPAISATTEAPSAMCQTIANIRHSLAIVVKLPRIASDDGILVGAEQKLLGHRHIMALCMKILSARCAARSCRTSWSVVCEKSTYHMPTEENGFGIERHTTSSAISRRAAQASQAPTGTATTTRAG